MKSNLLNLNFYCRFFILFFIGMITPVLANQLEGQIVKIDISQTQNLYDAKNNLLAKKSKTYVMQGVIVKDKYVVCSIANMPKEKINVTHQKEKFVLKNTIDSYKILDLELKKIGEIEGTELIVLFAETIPCFMPLERPKGKYSQPLTVITFKDMPAGFKPSYVGVASVIQTRLQSHSNRYLCEGIAGMPILTTDNSFIGVIGSLGIEKAETNLESGITSKNTQVTIYVSAREILSTIEKYEKTVVEETKTKVEANKEELKAPVAESTSPNKIKEEEKKKNNE